MFSRVSGFELQKLHIADCKAGGGCPHIMSANGGRESVSQMLTISEEGGRGGKPKCLRTILSNFVATDVHALFQQSFRKI